MLIAAVGIAAGGVQTAEGICKVSLHSRVANVAAERPYWQMCSSERIREVRKSPGTGQ